MNDLDGAVHAYREAIDLEPNSVKAHINLGFTLRQKNDLEDAIRALHKATQLDQNVADAHFHLANGLYLKKDWEGAIAAYRKAIDLQPKLAKAHYNFGLALHEKKDLEGEVHSFRIATELDPNVASALINLGNGLRAKKDFEGAIRAYRKAIELDPKIATAHANLGLALHDKKDLERALMAFRTAIQLNPNDAKAHLNLGNALREKKDFKGAITAYSKAVHLEPNYAEAHCNLGLVYREKGQFAEALKFLGQGHALASRQANWRYPSRQWLNDCQQLLTMDRKLMAFLDRGEPPPATAERLALVDFCRRSKHYHACAARLFAGLFVTCPALADDLAKGYRYKAACSALLAAAGKGLDPKPLDAVEKSKLRAQALEWLRADIDSFAYQFRGGNARVTALMLAGLPRWDKTEALASVRGARAQAAFPGPEQEAWQKLWSDRDELLQQLRASVTEIQMQGTLSTRDRALEHEWKSVAGTTCIIDLHSTAFDAYLKLLDARGNVLAEHNDIAPDNQDARLIVTSKVDGTLRIVATSLQQRGTGPYTLTIRAICGKNK